MCFSAFFMMDWEDSYRMLKPSLENAKKVTSNKRK